MAAMEESNTRRRQRVAEDLRVGRPAHRVRTADGVCPRAGRTRRVQCCDERLCVRVRAHAAGRRVVLRNRTNSAKNAGPAGSLRVLNWRRCATTRLRARGEMAWLYTSAAVLWRGRRTHNLRHGRSLHGCTLGDSARADGPVRCIIFFPRTPH